MSQEAGGLTRYEFAYLAGGPRRVAETAVEELLRRGALRTGPGGELACGGADGGNSADGARDELEQVILGLAARPGGVSRRFIRLRCGSWRPVQQTGAALAAAGLALSRRQRQVALILALIMIAAGAAAAIAIAGGWQIAPTARSPLAAAAAVVIAGLLLRAGRRSTSDGRERLAAAASTGAAGSGASGAGTGAAAGR